ncbi:MAG: UDP-N-acetylmuramate--L-alanine ligase [Clostridia bacterium]|nr:UDP-N-acetylmuramate--L-alanine ligase [Clostridia bacterium]
MNELKLLKSKKFHFIGIGGISMSALALMLKKSGFYVQGSNDVLNDELKKLMKRKVRIFFGHSKSNVLGADVVVYSSAIHDDNPELMYARKNNLIIIKRAELLGIIAETYKTVIAVAGSHGKTTATAMIAEIFDRAGLKPTVHIGGKVNSFNSNYKIGNKKYFITENCEYKDNFLFVKPDISVILNIDSDHLDYFENLENVKLSFLKYAQNIRENGLVIACKNDENSREILDLENCVSFGFGRRKSDVFAANIKEYKKGYYSFDVMIDEFFLGKIKLSVFGKHNVFNALAAIFVGLICDIDFEVIKDSIENFSGVERRGEFVGEIGGVKIYHDYAHHPKQIEKMISVANELKCDSGRVITIFEPHTYSRTKFLLKDFAKSFSKSNLVIFAPVYSAREDKSEGLSSLELCNETKKFVDNSRVFNSYKDIVLTIKNECKKDDIVLVLGAGNIEKLAKMLID